MWFLKTFLLNNYVKNKNYVNLKHYVGQTLNVNVIKIAYEGVIFLKILVSQEIFASTIGF